MKFMFFFLKKPVYKSPWSNWPLNPRSQSSKLNFFKKLEKNFRVQSRGESSFSFTNSFLYTNYEKH